MRILVVWERVLESDTEPPRQEVRALLEDPRVIEFWDERPWMSARVVERLELVGRVSELGPRKVAWDFIALFPAGAGWEAPFPTPSWYGAPVIQSLEPVKEALEACTDRTR